MKRNRKWYGWTGTILEVDLTRESVRKVDCRRSWPTTISARQG